MKEKSLKLMNDSIKAIRDFCSDLDIDCYRDYCPFGTNCPSEIGDVPPSDWEKLEEKPND